MDDVLRSVALQQTARYSRDCRVFAPVYRQTTIYGLLESRAPSRREMREQAYADVREAWRTYLRQLQPRPRRDLIVSHSQGSFVLRKLIAEEVDGKPAVRKRLVSALLLGGNVTVKKGSDRGGDFKHIRACRSRRQLELRDRVLDLQRDAAGQQPVRPDHRHPALRGALHQPGRAGRRRRRSSRRCTRPSRSRRA